MAAENKLGRIGTAPAPEEFGNEAMPGAQVHCQYGCDELRLPDYVDWQSGEILASAPQH